ncbi:MAG: response regulator transcription factor [Cyclobacteriaceae bacterium]
MLRVLLVDDHEIIRDAIRAYFAENDNIELTAEAANGKLALECLDKEEFDLVLTDINMPEMDGLELMKEISTRFPGQKVLVLSMFSENIQIKQMIELGANGYVLKNVAKQELFDAIEQIMSGKDYFSKEVYDVLIRSMAKRTPKKRLSLEAVLSEREKEILVLITQEMTNQEIADNLFISIRTVETHKRNLLEKTGCKNVAGLVMYAIERELV